MLTRTAPSTSNYARDTIRFRGRKYKNPHSAEILSSPLNHQFPCNPLIPQAK